MNNPLNIAEIAGAVGFKVQVIIAPELLARLDRRRAYHLLNKLFYSMRGSKTNRIDFGIRFPDGPIPFSAVSSRDTDGELIVTITP